VRVVNDEVDLVRVTSENAQVLRAVDEDIFDAELSGELVDAFVSVRSNLLVVAICKGTVIGQVQGNVQVHLDARPQLYIDNLGVGGRTQRQGVATALLAAIADWGVQRGCEQAWIVTEPENHAANALYQSIGALATNVTLYSFPTTTNNASSANDDHGQARC
jgi:ribosomal protein S18 acetylase RimI-like enzyme